MQPMQPMQPMQLRQPTGAPKEQTQQTQSTHRIIIYDEYIPPKPEEPRSPIYTTDPDGSYDWFYCLFGRCFGTLVLRNNRYYKKVCCFIYNSDGRGCYGCYEPEGEVFPLDEVEYYHPGHEYCALLFCGACLYYRWKKYSKNYKMHGRQYANYMYYQKETHYQYHECCKNTFLD
jgi:hypothetical protein